MLFGLVLVLHILVSFVLIGVILLQGGRGGLSDALGGAAAQSLFGGGVATVLTKITGACAAIFMVTCLSLAYLSTIRGRSVIEQMPLMAPESLPGALPSARPPMPVTPSPVPSKPVAHETPISSAPVTSSATSDAKPAEGTPTTPASVSESTSSKPATTSSSSTSH